MKRAKKFIALIILTAVLAPTTWAFADAARDQYAIAASFYSRQDWQTAVIQFDRFLQLFPTNPQAGLVHFYKGESQVQLGQMDSALNSYQEFLLRESDHTYSEQARFRIGECYFLLGKTALATSAFDNYKKRYPDGILNVHCLPYEAEISLINKDFTSAEKLYQQLLETPESKHLTVDATLGLARAYRGQKRLELAKKQYQQLIDLNPQHTLETAYYELGIIDYQLEQFDEAIDSLRNVNNKSGEQTPAAKYWIAKSYYKNNQWKNASDIFETILNENNEVNNQDEIIYLTGRCQFELEDYTTAESQFEKLISNHPESNWSEQAHFYLVDIQLKENNSKALLKRAEQLWKDHPEGKLSHSTRNKLGQHFLDNKKYDLAVKVLTVAQPVESEPTNDALNTERNYLLGLAFYAKGDFELAIEMLHSAEKQSNDTDQKSTASYLLGMSHFKENNYEPSIEAFQRSLTIKPESEFATQCKLKTAIAYAHLEKYNLAKKQLANESEFTTEQTDYLNAIHQIAELALKSGKTTIASELFTQLSQKNNPENFVTAGLTGLAWCQLEENNTIDSIATIEQLIEQNKDNLLVPTILFGHAETLRKNNKAELALEVFQRIVKDYPDSDHTADALIRLASLLDNNNQKKEAESYYQKLLVEHPDKIEQAEILYRLAWTQADQGNTKAAKVTLHKIYKSHKKSDLWHDAAYRLAEYAFREGNLKQAKNHLNSFYAKEAELEESRHAHYLSGRIAVTENNWATVVAEMNQVIVEPKEDFLSRMAYYWSAEGLFRQEKNSEAQKSFADLNNLVRGTDFQLQSNIQLRLAQLAFHRKEWEESFDLAEKIRLDHPEFEQLYEVDYLQARYMAHKAKFSSARETYQRVIHSEYGSKTETAAMAQWMIGETYFHQKKYDQAIEAYSRVNVLFNYPKWQAAALLQIGKCYEVRKQWPQANKYYEEVKKDYSQFSFAKEAEQRLGVIKQREQQANLASPNLK